ncbi:hypothetical protein AB0H57_06020 [Micromonospora sp. NPDC050686]|uniref:hypothetical protein n=1 Tax=Micromonospora sp. NPDC050686 TaxID=3154631 RepID=UPI0033C85CE4
MAKKMLGKVVAGAALGGASLLVFSPGFAFADGGHHDGEDRDGKVFAKPHVVKAGDKVELTEICSKEQEHAFVWSKVTGKVKLHEARDGEGDWRDKDKGDWRDEEKGDRRDEDKGDRREPEQGREEHGKDEQGKREQGKPEEGKPEEGKREQGKGEQGKGEQGKPEQGKGEQGPENGPWEPQMDGHGGGFAADDSGEKPGHPGEGKEEHGQESGKDWKDHEKGYGEEQGREERGDHAADEYGQDSWKKENDKYGQEENSWKKDQKESGWADEYGRGEDDWEHKRDFVYYGEARVDEHAKPGRYELQGSCGEGELVVLPRGGVDGGDGGMTSTGLDTGMAAGGAGMLGAAALGGIVLMRRRRTDGSLV